LRRATVRILGTYATGDSAEFVAGAMAIDSGPRAFARTATGTSGRKYTG
jgi:hypothetical protein